MRYGLWSMTGATPGLSHVDIYEPHRQEAEAPGRLGISHFWFFEHHVSLSSQAPSSNLLVAAAAQRIKRMRLGAMVNILPYISPLMPAEEAAMPDTPTRGRLDIGVDRDLELFAEKVRSQLC